MFSLHSLSTELVPVLQASKAAPGDGSAGGEAGTQANMAAAYTLVDLSKLQVGSTWLSLRAWCAQALVLSGQRALHQAPDLFFLWNMPRVSLWQVLAHYTLLAEPSCRRRRALERRRRRRCAARWLWLRLPTATARRRPPLRSGRLPHSSSASPLSPCALAAQMFHIPVNLPPVFLTLLGMCFSCSGSIVGLL